MSANDLERIFHSLPMLSQECSRKFTGAPVSYVRKFKTCVSHTQLAPWSSKSGSIGESFLGRVDNLIVFTTKERVRNSHKRLLDETPSDSTLSTIVNRLGWTRGFRRARRPNQTSSAEFTAKEVHDMREYVKSLINSESDLPSNVEIEKALIVSKRAKQLIDEHGSVIHSNVQISYNNCSVSNGFLQCPKLVVLVHVPAHVAVNVNSIGRMLEPLPSPVDCIYSCDHNPLKAILHHTPNETSNDHSQVPMMTIAMSIT